MQNNMLTYCLDNACSFNMFSWVKFYLEKKKVLLRTVSQRCLPLYDGYSDPATTFLWLIVVALTNCLNWSQFLLYPRKSTKNFLFWYK